MTTSDIEAELNAMLCSEKPSEKRLVVLIVTLAEGSGIKPELLDFEYYSETRMKELHSKKIECIKIQDFEKGAKYRQMEKNCCQYIDLRKEEKIDDSCFRIEGEFLFYFCTGSSKNDNFIKPLYKSLMEKYPIQYVDPD
jgi:ubiquitin